MPKKTKPATSGGGAANQLRSDDEIIKDRKLLEAFDTADLYLVSVGTGMWVFAGAYLFNFSENAPLGSSLYEGGNDPHLMLLVCGCFCRGIARSSPRAWSAWRRIWHVLWCPTFILLALSLLLPLLQGLELTGPRLLCWGLCAAFAALGVGSLAVLPGPSFTSRESASLPCARFLLCLDSVALLTLAGSILVGADQSASLGRFTSMLVGLPMGMWGIGLILCCTTAELLVAVWTVILFCLCSSLRACYFGGPSAMVPAALVLLPHLALYLPLPASEPRSNPFHMILAVAWQQTVKFMSNPVSGFGDSAD